MNILGICARARKIVTGDTLFKGIRNKSVNLVIIASDASDNSKKKLVDKCNYYEISYIIYSDTNSLSKAIGKNNRVAVGICDKALSASLKKEIGG